MSVFWEDLEEVWSDCKGECEIFIDKEHSLSVTVLKVNIDKGVNVLPSKIERLM